MRSAVPLARIDGWMHHRVGRRSRSRRSGLFAQIVTDVERRIVGSQTGQERIRRLSFSLSERECMNPNRSSWQACTGGIGQVCPDGP